MVEKKEIFRKIDGIINELNDQYQYLSKNQEGLNELELELFAANANFLSEHIRIIQKLNNPKGSSLPETAAKTKVAPEEAAIPEITDEDSGELEAGEKKVPSVSEDKESGDGKMAVEENIKREEQETAELRFSDEAPFEDNTAFEEKSSKKKQELESQKPVSADETVINEVVIRERTISVDIPAQDKLTKSGEHVPTVNDVMSVHRNQSTLGDNYSRQSVTDLKAIINLNDKLLFVKDLFNGYNLAYSEAIELLNRFDNFEVADNFLKNNYAAKNNWAEKQSTVDKFYEILNRRFSK